MNNKFVIKGTLPSLNEYIKKINKNRYAGNEFKSNWELYIMKEMAIQKVNKCKKYPLKFKINWYEKDKRRDIDNITFATKFIFDAMVKFGTIENDGQKQIAQIAHKIDIDKSNPRIEVEWI